MFKVSRSKRHACLQNVSSLNAPFLFDHSLGSRASHFFPYTIKLVSTFLMSNIIRQKVLNEKVNTFKYLETLKHSIFSFFNYSQFIRGQRQTMYQHALFYKSTSRRSAWMEETQLGGKILLQVSSQVFGRRLIINKTSRYSAPMLKITLFYKPQLSCL